jgi:DNA polymerase-3 subunit alpha
LARLDAAISSAQRRQKASARGQIGLFDMGSVSMPQAVEPAIPADVHAIPPKEKLAWEKELLGLYLSAHPLTEVLDAGVARGVTNILDLEDWGNGGRVTVIGMVTSVRRITTKNNRSMAIVNLEDLTGTIEMVVFPDCFERLPDVWQEDAILEVTGKPERRGDDLQLVCENATAQLHALQPRPEPTQAVHVMLPGSAGWWQDTAALHRLDGILREHDGEAEVVLHIVIHGQERVLRSQSRRVEWSDRLRAELSELLGEDAARLEVMNVAMQLAS